MKDKSSVKTTEHSPGELLGTLSNDDGDAPVCRVWQVHARVPFETIILHARIDAFHAVALKLRYVKRLKNTCFSHFWSKTATIGDQSQP